MTFNEAEPVNPSKTGLTPIPVTSALDGSEATRRRRQGEGDRVGK